MWAAHDSIPLRYLVSIIKRIKYEKYLCKVWEYSGRLHGAAYTRGTETCPGLVFKKVGLPCNSYDMQVARFDVKIHSLGTKRGDRKVPHGVTIGDVSV